jgi:hypothetical protein
MIMFIASEVMFFVAWFWAYFDASLFYDEAQQFSAPRLYRRNLAAGGHRDLDPLHLPLYNTVILLLSGTTVTWAHHALLHGDRKGLKWGLALTVLLGILFTSVQAYEYAMRPIPSPVHLRRDLLHGDRLPRLPRSRRNDLPAVCLFRAMAGPVHAKTAFRLRGGRLVLALRRRCLAVPVLRHLCLGFLGRADSSASSWLVSPSGLRSITARRCGCI